MNKTIGPQIVATQKAVDMHVSTRHDGGVDAKLVYFMVQFFGYNFKAGDHGRTKRDLYEELQKNVKHGATLTASSLPTSKAAWIQTCVAPLERVCDRYYESLQALLQRGLAKIVE